MWRYFIVGAGVFIKYSKDLSFHLTAVTITLYVRQLPKFEKKKKELADRHLCKIMFCCENDCILK